MKMPNGKALRDCSLDEIEIYSAYLQRRLNTLRAKAPIRQVRAALKSGGASFAISKGLAIGLPRKKIDAVISAGR
jgi:hypothetical protein